VLVPQGIISLQRPVKLIERDALPATIDQRSALDRVREAWSRHGSGLAPLVADDAQERVPFQVTVNDKAEDEVWDCRVYRPRSIPLHQKG